MKIENYYESSKFPCENDSSVSTKLNPYNFSI